MATIQGSGNNLTPKTEAIRHRRGTGRDMVEWKPVATTNEQLMNRIEALSNSLAALDERVAKTTVESVDPKDIIRIENELRSLSDSISSVKQSTEPLAVLSANVNSVDQLLKENRQTVVQLQQDQRGLTTAVGEVRKRLPPIASLATFAVGVLTLLGVSYKDISSYQSKMNELEESVTSAREDVEAASTTVKNAAAELEGSTTAAVKARETTEGLLNQMATAEKTLFGLAAEISLLRGDLKSRTRADSPAGFSVDDGATNDPAVNDMLASLAGPTAQQLVRATRALEQGDAETARQLISIGLKNVRNDVERSGFELLQVKIFIQDSDFKEAVGLATKVLNRERAAGRTISAELNAVQAAFFAWGQHLGMPEGKGKMNEALPYAREAFELDTNDIVSTANLVTILDVLDMHEEMLTILDQFSGEDHWRLMSQRAIALAALNRADEATLHAVKAIEMDGRAAFILALDEEMKVVQGRDEFWRAIESALGESMVLRIKAMTSAK